MALVAAKRVSEQRWRLYSPYKDAVTPFIGIREIISKDGKTKRFGEYL